MNAPYPTASSRDRRIKELEAELAKLKRGAKTLGEMHTKTLKWVIEASNSEDLIGDDGDGDWEIVWDRLFQLRPELDAALTKLTSIETFCEQSGSEIYTDDIYAILDGKS